MSHAFLTWVGRKLINSKSKGTRDAGIAVLGKANDKAAVDELLSKRWSLERERHEWMRKHNAREQLALSPKIREAECKDSLERIETALKTHFNRAPAATREVLEERVRARAKRQPRHPDYWDFGMLGCFQAFDFLLELFVSSPTDYSEAALRRLERMDGTRIVAAFRGYLKSGPLESRRRVANAMSSLPLKECTEPLIAALRDPEAEMRAAAARGLGFIGDRQTVESLILAVSDSQARVRREAVEALGRIGDDRAEDLLQRVAANDSDEFVRYNALRALGKAGTIRSVPFLLRKITALSERESSQLALFTTKDLLPRVLGEVRDEDLALILKFKNTFYNYGEYSTQPGAEGYAVAYMDFDFLCRMAYAEEARRKSGQPTTDHPDWAAVRKACDNAPSSVSARRVWPEEFFKSLRGE